MVTSAVPIWALTLAAGLGLAVSGLGAPGAAGAAGGGPRAGGGGGGGGAPGAGGAGGAAAGAGGGWGAGCCAGAAATRQKNDPARAADETILRIRRVLS